MTQTPARPTFRADPQTPITLPDSLTTDNRLLTRLTWAFVALGIVLRLTRWLLRYPLWHDEAFLAVNFIDRGPGDLLRPLDYLQVSPIGFLLLEQLAVAALGFSEWSLRLVPTLAAMAALLVFRDLATRLLRPWAAFLAVATMAVAQSPLRHGNEVKPYALDLLAAVVLLALAIAWWQRPDRLGRLRALAVATPFAIVLSMPAIFVAGGVGLALLGRVIQDRRQPVILTFAAFGIGLLASFALVMGLSLATPASEILREFYLLNYWDNSFPPTEHGPLAVAVWLAAIHAGNLFAYPIGGESGASLLTLIAATAGAIGLARGRRWMPLVALLAPFGLTLLAAAARRYPYGGEARIAQHLAPAVCLLAGLGAARLLDRLHPAPRRRAAALALVASLALIGAGQFAHSLVKPYQLESSQNGRAFARWFWPMISHNATVVCVKTDLHRDFEPWQWVTGISAEYLCNQAIYAPAQKPPADLVPIPGRPLRGVMSRVESYDPIWRKPAFRDWVDPLRRRYRLQRIDTYPINIDQPGPDWKRAYYHVLEFHARSSDTPTAGHDALDDLLAPPSDE